MAFSSIATVTVSNPVKQQPSSHDLSAPLLSMVVLSVYAAQKSRKSFRKLKRKFMWTSFKLKLKSMFNRHAQVSGNLLLYIIIGVLVLALLIVSPIAALILAIIALILFLTGII